MNFTDYDEKEIHVYFPYTRIYIVYIDLVSVRISINLDIPERWLVAFVEHTSHNLQKNYKLWFILLNPHPL